MSKEDLTKDPDWQHDVQKENEYNEKMEKEAKSRARINPMVVAYGPPKNAQGKVIKNQTCDGCGHYQKGKGICLLRSNVKRHEPNWLACSKFLDKKN